MSAGHVIIKQAINKYVLKADQACWSPAGLNQWASEHNLVGNVIKNLHKKDINSSAEMFVQ